MKKFLPLILIFIFLFAACGGDSSSDEFVSSSNVYEMKDVTSAGWKMKKGFEIAEFPESTDARWGFAGPDGREVAVIRYPNTELANTKGLQAAQEQTEYIEPIEGITAYGDKVEKTTCRGFADYPPPYKVTQEKNLGINKTFLLNKNNFIEESLDSINADCPRREPFYRVYLIEGNLVFLGELLRKEDLQMVDVFLEELAIKVREGKE
ncbi:MAG: hypothetical protein ACJ0GV_00605 [Dehalococcoidia bacterium]|nr:hypothetical protein [Chloroflexota bacterium]|tara:strand:- start:918 stop:1541 length:624 start_codon:yes stop_codon:yes gene_type:complete